MGLIAFGEFVFDAADGTVIDGASRVPLTPTERAVLATLLDSAGAVVTQAQLLERAWPDVHVSPSTVTRLISRLRSRLRDRGRQPRIIATVTRRGYRLLVEARPLDRSNEGRHWMLPIAVLPITPASDDLGDLAHGLTERLIDGVSRLPGARVVGLASILRFAGRPVSPGDAMSQLSARSVMSGVLRREGDDLMLALELSTADSTGVWSCDESAARDQIHLLEATIVRRFASWFAPAAGTAFVAPPTASAAAYEQLVEGLRLARNFMSLATLAQATNCLSEAIRLDPHLTPAYLVLADVHLKRRFFGDTADASREARRCLDAVLALEPRCAPALAMRGVLIEEMDWDREGAVMAVREAATLAPADPVVHLWCAAFFDRRGQYAESLAHLDAGLAIDPLSMDLLVGRLSSLVKAGMYREAEKQVAAMVPLMPGGIGVSIVASVGAYMHAALGHRRKAVELAGSIMTSPLADPSSMAWAILALARAKEIRAARAAIAVLEERGAIVYVPAYFFAVVYGSVGERETALMWFERAVDERSPHVLYGANVPGFESIREAPRFRAALARIGPQ